MQCIDCIPIVFTTKVMYLLYNSACLTCQHQLVRDLIPIGAPSHFICHAVSFQLQCGGCCGGFRIANKLGRTAFVFSLYIFFCFLSFVCKKYINFGVDKLALCIHTLSLNASMPRSMPSLFAGFSYLHDKGERVGRGTT